jgi:anti-sigma factor RsiW
MTCVSPPELNDRELLVYIDGEADPQVMAHLERCSYCRQKALRLARLQKRLANELYRFTCPSTLELGEYHLGILPSEQAAAVARHLAECPHCAREVAQLEDFLGELAPQLEFSPFERLKVRVAQLVERGRGVGRAGAPALAPACSGLRGQEEGTRVYQADDVQVVLEVQDDAGQQARRALLGLVTQIDGQEFEAHLWRAERLVATAAVDELGNFVMAGLTPGIYELILCSPEVEIHIQSLQI